jgi:hypothetical protein
MKVEQIFLSLFLLSSAAQASNSENVHLSLGSGYPFFTVVEASLPAMNDDQRWFANYKLGLDDGFSVGFEQTLAGNMQTVGFSLGAIGARDAVGCDENKGAGAIICPIVEIFDSETTNGAAFNYSYYFSGVNSSGTKIRFELGYGQSNQANVKRFDGSVIISYQF